MKFWSLRNCLSQLDYMIYAEQWSLWGSFLSGFSSTRQLNYFQHTKAQCDSKPTDKPPTVAPTTTPTTTTTPSSGICDEGSLVKTPIGLWKCQSRTIGANVRKICGYVCAANENLWKSPARVKCWDHKNTFERIDGFLDIAFGVCK